MSDQQTPSENESQPGSGGRSLAWWTSTPLYQRILCGLALGMLVGVAARHPNQAYGITPQESWLLAIPYQASMLILKVLGALAPPLILAAVLDTLINAGLAPGVGRR